MSHITRGLPPLSFTAGGKVPASYWGAGNGEDEMQFHVGAFVRGVVDKNAFTKYGLVHGVQELYGNAAAGKLLSAFSRLFTFFLQWHGFTCGERARRQAYAAPRPTRSCRRNAAYLDIRVLLTIPQSTSSASLLSSPRSPRHCAGFDDLLLVRRAEDERRRLLAGAETVALAASAALLDDGSGAAALPQSLQAADASQAAVQRELLKQDLRVRAAA